MSSRLLGRRARLCCLMYLQLLMLSKAGSRLPYSVRGRDRGGRAQLADALP